MPADQLLGVKHALLITTANSTNKSVISLENTLKQKGLDVVQIGSLKAFKAFEQQHPQEKVLVVRSPIPNQAEYPIMQYIKHGPMAAFWAALQQSPWLKIAKVKLYKSFYYVYFRLKPEAAKDEAAQFGLLKAAKTVRAGEHL